MADLSIIRQTLVELKERQGNEPTMAGREAVGNRIYDLLNRAGDIYAREIDPVYWPGHSGNKAETIFARRRFIKEIRLSLTNSQERK